MDDEFSMPEYQDFSNSTRAVQTSTMNFSNEFSCVVMEFASMDWLTDRISYANLTMALTLLSLSDLLTEKEEKTIARITVAMNQTPPLWAKIQSQ
jgi:hypothetical protein